MPSLRHVHAALGALVLAVGVGVALTSHQAVAQEAVTVAAQHPASCTAPAPTTAAGYQAMFDDKDDATWAGGDQAATVALPDGRELWLFGDTLRGDRLVHNSLLLQRGGCLTAVAAHDEVIPTRTDGQWYWPQSAVVQGKQLLVFCGRVVRTGPGAFDFRTTGTELAVFDLSARTPRFVRMAATPSTIASEEHSQYGAATVRDGDWLYVYGTRHVSGAFGRSVTVARVHPSEVLSAASWRFWTGQRWSTSAALAAPVADRWSTALSVWRAPDGSFRSLTKKDDVYGHSVVAGRASSPTSGFSHRVVLDAPSTKAFLHYNALAHPEIRLPSGLLLVTVCQNSTDLTRVIGDHSIYKPQFQTVRP
ncbi:MAG: hypothetical protein JWO22_197 [Frankiales bacterium]|nr:hypothetical protein [Frankiales bacterium]